MIKKTVPLNEQSGFDLIVYNIEHSKALSINLVNPSLFPVAVDVSDSS